MKTIALAAAVPILFASPATQAAIAHYDNAAAFSAAVLGTALIDFESPALPRDLGNTLVIEDVTFESTDGSGLYLSGPSRTTSFGTVSTILTAENFGGLRISSSKGFSGIGFDVGEIFGPDRFHYQIVTSDGSMVEGDIDVAIPSAQNSITSTTFHGWRADGDLIKSVQIQSFSPSPFGSANRYESIDNVRYLSVATSIPEPTTTTLMWFCAPLIYIIANRRATKKTA